MNFRHAFNVFAGAAALSLAAVSSGRCDDVPPVKLTIYPAAAPRPALKYQLLPDFKDRMRGNAAVYYGKVTAERLSFFTDQAMTEKIEHWRQVPLAELREDDVSMPTQGIEDLLARAARCESCDWQLPIREEALFTIILNEVQQTRRFARILATRARIQIARGEFDDAVKTLQSGYALARNVTEGETLVNGLVSTAICGMLSEQIFEFVQQPAAPNLYWALTTLPRPLADMRKGVEAEMNSLAISFPEVRDLDAKRSPDQWREELYRFWENVHNFMDDNDKKDVTPDSMAAASIKAYPAAKHALLEHGMSAEVIDAMPAAQVVLVYTIQTVDDLRDDVFKWFFVSYPESVTGADAAIAELKRAEVEHPDLVPLMKLLAPISSIRTPPAALSRQVAILRLIEALRIYGSGHEGRLPAKLEDVIEVPIPADPVTGKAFEYRLDGDSAVVQVTPLPGRPASYEIRMARP